MTTAAEFDAYMAATRFRGRHREDSTYVRVAKTLRRAKVRRVVDTHTTTLTTPPAERIRTPRSKPGYQRFLSALRWHHHDAAAYTPVHTYRVTAPRA